MTDRTPDTRTRAAALGALSAVAIALAAANGAASASEQAVTFGTAITLSGEVPTDEAGKRVEIVARPYGTPSFDRVAVVLTTPGGRWRYEARPTIRTLYRAVWEGIETKTILVRVTPFLDLDIRRGVLFARARASGSLAGKRVSVQLRRPTQRWRTVRRLRLDSASRARYRPRLPLGRSDLRLYMSAQEAGPGYAGGYSPILTFHNGR